uniref:Uncharacterized protein n=1 Tax=Meloidogyne hapla TaxID=6305 RepID=A0A1I8AXV7_MELHA
MNKIKDYIKIWKNEVIKLESEYKNKNTEFLKIIEENKNTLNTKKWFENQIQEIRNKINLIENYSEKWNFKSINEKFGNVEINIKKIIDEWNKKLEESDIEITSLKRQSKKGKGRNVAIIEKKERKKLSEFLFNGKDSSPNKTIKTIIDEETKNKTLTNKLCPNPIRKSISRLLGCFINF